MRWLKDYQLFLLDFDGLLVNTEELHYEAYQLMCKEQGFDLPWDFSTYCQHAHTEATAIRDGVYKLFPELYAKEPNWDTLYQRKRWFYSDLLENRGVDLMPGVEGFLLALQEADVTRCVVTHSADIHVMPIREKNPVLNTIPHWLMRNDYDKPKPDPECYQVAIERFAGPDDQVIGFEDTPRGMTALLGTRAQAVWVTSTDYPGIEFSDSKIICLPGFENLPDELPAHI